MAAYFIQLSLAMLCLPKDLKVRRITSTVAR